MLMLHGAEGFHAGWKFLLSLQRNIQRKYLPPRMLYPTAASLGVADFGDQTQTHLIGPRWLDKVQSRLTWGLRPALPTWNKADI